MFEYFVKNGSVKCIKVKNLFIDEIFKTELELKFPRRSLDWYRFDCKNETSCINGYGCENCYQSYLRNSLYMIIIYETNSISFGNT